MPPAKKHPNSGKIASIRIIGGAYKGKILHAASFSHTRPTKAIIKESIFNTLAQEICGKVFLEVFGGFGSIGFEAFSRGAKHVIFIEKNKQTFEILQKNIRLFGAQDSQNIRDSQNIIAQAAQDSQNIRDSQNIFGVPKIAQDSQNIRDSHNISAQASPLVAFLEDSFAFLPILLARQKIDILYFDPPFGDIFYTRCFALLEDFLKENKREILVIFEHDSKFIMPLKIAHLNRKKTRKFGRSAISYYA